MSELNEQGGFLKLSASSVKTFDQCRKKYWFNYIEKAQRKEWDHLILGSLVHKALELFHSSYIKQPIAKSGLGKLMKESFDLALNEFKVSDKMKTEAFGLLKDYLSTTKEDMGKVIGVEVPFEFELNDEFIVRGYIDRIDNDNGKFTIKDYKTTKNPKYLDAFQLSIYGLWLKKQYPEIKEFNGSYILLRHKSTTKDFKFNLRDLDRTRKELITYGGQIKTEEKWPVSPSPLCRYCDFNSICESQKAW